MFGARPFASRPFASAAQVLSLTAAKGTFTFTGVSQTITSVRHFSAAVGTFTLTGKASQRGLGFLAGTGSFIVSGTTIKYSRLFPFGACPFGGAIFEPNVTSVASAALLIVNRAPPTFITRRGVAPSLVKARSVQPALIQRRQVATSLIRRRVNAPSLGD